MSVRATSLPRAPRGHTLIELMVAIIIGIILVLAAFKVLSAFEGSKRTTTGMNDAMQSGNFGLFEIDKLIRSAGTGLSQYASISGAGYGGALNYTPTGGALITAGVVPSPGLPMPFTGVVGTSATSALRMAPAVIFGGVTTAVGFSDSAGATAATSDVLLLMLGGSGFGEVPVAVSNAAAPMTLQSIVGFNAGDWVINAPASLGECMISKVDASFAPGTGWTSAALNLPLTTGSAAVGDKTVATGDYIIDLGAGTAANFVLYGVDSTTSTLRSVDLLNSAFDIADAKSQNVSDDIVLLKAVYEVDPGNSGTGSWIKSGDSIAATIAGTSTTVNYAATTGTDCLLCGTSNASTALKGVKAIRVAMIVRAPIQENANEAQNTTINFNAQSFPLFASLPNDNSVQSTWYPPKGTVAQPQNYRYREIETTIPIRNNGLL